MSSGPQHLHELLDTIDAEGLHRALEPLRAGQSSTHVTASYVAGESRRGTSYWFGTSRAGLWEKNPLGRSDRPVISVVITGYSSTVG